MLTISSRLTLKYKLHTDETVSIIYSAFSNCQRHNHHRARTAPGGSLPQLARQMLPRATHIMGAVEYYSSTGVDTTSSRSSWWLKLWMHISSNVRDYMQSTKSKSNLAANNWLPAAASGACLSGCLTFRFANTTQFKTLPHCRFVFSMCERSHGYLFTVEATWKPPMFSFKINEKL